MGSSAEDDTMGTSQDVAMEEPPLNESERHNQNWARHGNEVSMKKIVDILYSKVLSDPQLAPFFSAIDMVKLKRHQEKLMAWVFGGIDLIEDDTRGSGFDMRAIHMRPLVEGGLTLQHWAAFVGHFEDTLQGLHDVPSEVKGSATAWLRATQPAFKPPLPEEVAAYQARQAAAAAAEAGASHGAMLSLLG